MTTLLKPANISDSEFNFLLFNWNNITLKYNVPWDEAEEVLSEILEQYAQPNRFYHNIKHVYSFLKTLDEHKRLIVNYDTLCMAAWFHDVIYNTKREDNEEKSASFAGVKLNFLGLNEYSINRIKQLILSTKNHKPYKEDYDDFLFADSDLRILGENFDTYMEYVHAIRQEYSHVNKVFYTYHRKKILNELLQRKAIYYTTHFKENFQVQAFDNIRKELSSLKYF